MERQSWLLLGLEALPASLLVHFGAIISEHKHCDNTATNLNSGSAISRMVAKEDESSTGHVWAAGFHHVMAHSRLAHVLKLMNHLFL